MKHPDYPSRKALHKGLVALEGRLDAKMDTKLQYWSGKIVDQISAVISDRMMQIDWRFQKIEKELDRSHSGWGR